MGVVVTACRRGHDTFRALLAPPSNPVAKWQQAMIVFTAFMGMLTIDIWMYQTRANNCCVEARAILECYDLPPAPCRGFTGDCADLPAQFADTGPQNPFIDSAGNPYVCRQFPDPARPTDKIIVSLIMVAVALPTRSIIGRLYEVSNQPVGLDEGLWLRKLGLVKLAVGNLSWHFADGSAKAWQRDLVKYDAADVAAAKVVARGLRKAARWLARLAGWGPAQPAGTSGRHASSPTDSRQAGRKPQRARQPSRAGAAQGKHRAFHLRLLHMHLSAAGRGRTVQADCGTAADTQQLGKEQAAGLRAQGFRSGSPPEKADMPQPAAPPSRPPLSRRSTAVSKREHLRTLASAARLRTLCALATLFVYCSWAILLWCVRGPRPGGLAAAGRAREHAALPSWRAALPIPWRSVRLAVRTRASPHDSPQNRFTLVYGGLVYQLLGDKAESAFAHDWGVGLAIDHATQWKSVLQSSLETALVLTLMDRLGLVPGSKWLEARAAQPPACSAAPPPPHNTMPQGGRQRRRRRAPTRGLCPAAAQVHLDQWSVQATLFHGQAVGHMERVRQHLAHTARLEVR